MKSCIFAWRQSNSLPNIAFQPNYVCVLEEIILLGYRSYISTKAWHLKCQPFFRIFTESKHTGSIRSSSRNLHIYVPSSVFFFLRGDSKEPCRPTRKRHKNEELFRIAHMDYPHLGTWKSLPDQLRRALKTRSCSGLHTWIVHAWEVFDGWTGALVDQLIEQ